MITIRPLPVAPRPFVAEALGSWVGRLAAWYRMGVAQLDADYGVLAGEVGHAALRLEIPGAGLDDDRVALLRCRLDVLV